MLILIAGCLAVAAAVWGYVHDYTWLGMLGLVLKMVFREYHCCPRVMPKTRASAPRFELPAILTPR